MTSIIKSCLETVSYCYSEFCDEWESRFPDAQAKNVNKLSQQAFISNENVCDLLCRREIYGRSEPLQKHFALQQLPVIELRVKQDLADLCNISSSDFQELPVYYCTSPDQSGAVNEVLQFTCIRRSFVPLVSSLTVTSRFRNTSLGNFSYIYICIAPNVNQDEDPYGQAFVCFDYKNIPIGVPVGSRKRTISLTREESTILKLTGLDMGTTKRHIPMLENTANTGL